MRPFGDLERKCEATFANGGQFWHAYTSGIDTPLLFPDERALSFAMNTIAQAAFMYPDIVIVAFEVMNNHFHFVLSAEKERILSFWDFIQRKIKRFLPEIASTKLSINAIDTLKSLRNNIAYTHRNGYVANPSFTPFNYPWGTGRYYFMDCPACFPKTQLRYDDLRSLLRCRTPHLPADCQMTSFGMEQSTGTHPGVYIAPSSYCAIKFGMEMFRNAHHYFSAVSKNVEAYCGVAVEIGDEEFLTDTELFAQLSAILHESYRGSSLKTLSKSQKLDLARTLRNTFHSSNSQIRRLLGLTQYEIDSLFPLSACKKK